VIQSLFLSPVASFTSRHCPPTDPLSPPVAFLLLSSGSTLQPCPWLWQHHRAAPPSHLPPPVLRRLPTEASKSEASGALTEVSLQYSSSVSPNAGRWNLERTGEFDPMHGSILIFLPPKSIHSPRPSAVTNTIWFSKKLATEFRNIKSNGLVNWHW
jgi:hypothetical protein